MTTTHDVVIVGGGILGLMLAHTLVRRSPSLRIALCDAPVVRGASAAAGAMLAPFSEVTASLARRPYHEERLGHARAAVAAWSEILADAAETAGVELVTARGTIVVRNTVSGPLEDRNFEAIVACLRDHGAAFEHVAPDRIDGLAPAPHERPVEAIRIPHELAVDTGLLLSWLRDALSRAPALTWHDTPIARVRSDGGRAIGVEDVAGVALDAAAVVLCGGVRSRALVPVEAGRDRIPPLFAGAGVAILAGGAPVALRHILRTPNRSFSCGLHVLPRTGGGVYIGATNNPSTRTWSAPSLSDVEFLVSCATRQIHQGLGRSPALALLTGNRPIALDLSPIVGRTALGGLWIATGTYREGLTLSPLIAGWLADDLLGGVARYPASYTPLRPPAPLASRDAAIEEAVDNHLAVAAEHESRFTAAGWSSFVRDAVTARVAALYDRLPDGLALPPDLAGLAEEDEPGLRDAVAGYLAAWSTARPTQPRPPGGPERTVTT
jgi:glycine/D-amino acid oxidase-like deaminating enzyme